jgi:hypothetical protein
LTKNWLLIDQNVAKISNFGRFWTNMWSKYQILAIFGKPKLSKIQFWTNWLV